jgi:hypothetical protein
MMNWKILLCVFATLFAAACGGRSESITEVAADAAALPCIPGEQVACACMEGAKGYQICKAGGQAFYPCECPEAAEDAGTDAIAVDAKSDGDALVEVDADAQAEADAKADADAGSDADADALALETGVDAEAGADAAEAEATVDAEAGVDADAGADADAQADADAEAGTKVILTISGAPGSPTEFNPGTTGVKPHKLQFCTTKKIELTGTQLYLQIVSGGAKTQGSMGTRYFRNIKLADNGQTVMGPTELKTTNNETMPQRAEFYNEPVMIDAGCKILEVVMDIWNIEDAPGELYNQVYQIQDIGAAALVKAGGDEPVDRPMNSDEFLWTPDSTSANFTILPLEPVIEVKTSSDTPASDIVVAGKDAFYPFSKQDVCNLTDNPVTFGVSYVQQACDGTGGDFYRVDVNYGGTNIHSSSAFDTFQVGFAIGPYVDVTIPAKNCLQATVLGKTQPVMPTSILPGDNTVARSGHAPCLRLVKFADSNGVQIPTKYTVSDKPNPMVLRKVKPIVTKQNLANYVIFNGEMALYCWQVGVDSATSTDAMAYKQDMFDIVSSEGVQLCNFKLYRNSSIMSGAYSVTDAVNGSDLRASCKPGSQHVMTAALSFADQEAIYNGQSNIYCLRSIVLKTFSTGNSITTKFYSYSPSVNKTGQLLNNDDYAPYMALPNVFNVGGLADPQTQLGAWHMVGDMVWSDQSELPHSTSVLGSKDWTNSFLVQNRTLTTVLSD